MPAFVAVNVIVFLMMGGGGSRRETLVEWGASFGPRTTNGEWWRLAASMFVHTGFLQLLVNCAALVQLGLILERLVGHITFAAVYFAAGVLASLVSAVGLSDGHNRRRLRRHLRPVRTPRGVVRVDRHPARSVARQSSRNRPQSARSGSISWRLRRPSPSRPSQMTPAPSCGPSVAMTLDRCQTARACCRGLRALQPGERQSSAAAPSSPDSAAGFICGVVLTTGVSVRTPPVPRVAITMAVTVVVASGVGGAAARHGRRSPGNLARHRSRRAARRRISGRGDAVQARNACRPKRWRR